MGVQRFYIPNIQLEEGQYFHIDDERVVHQLTRVLRAKVADPLIIFNGKVSAQVHIVELGKKTVEVAVGKKAESVQEAARAVTLYCALLKRDRFEFAVQKATEVGVHEIVPLLTMRVVKLGLQKERLQKIIIEAAEQCGRTSIPVLRNPVPLSEAVTQAKKENQQNIFFHQEGEHIKNIALQSGQVGIFIGPEGGWDEQEVALAQEGNMQLATLGPLVLRAETAAAAASYLATTQ